MISFKGKGQGSTADSSHYADDRSGKEKYILAVSGMRPAGHFEALELSFFRAHFVLLDCGHCYCAGGRLKIYYTYIWA